MTTIAWDGKILAADTVCNGPFLSHTKKIFRINTEILIGVSGPIKTVLRAVEWSKNGFNENEWPFSGEDNEPYILKIEYTKKQTKIFEYELCPFPTFVHNEFYAIGSGAQSALAAMCLGVKAPEAIKIASIFDVYTGGNIDYFKIENNSFKHDTPYIWTALPKKVKCFYQKF